jgi:hypothetical protein
METNGRSRTDVVVRDATSALLIWSAMRTAAAANTDSSHIIGLNLQTNA